MDPNNYSEKHSDSALCFTTHIHNTQNPQVIFVIKYATATSTETGARGVTSTYTLPEGVFQFSFIHTLKFS
jgi:hypothetical protein